MNKYIIRGPIDTVEEINLLLDFLQRKGLLVQNKQMLDESVLFLRTLQERRQLYGPVDTPGEIQLFLSFMRKKGFVGAIDTPEELQLLMKSLGEEGLLGPRYEVPSINPKPYNTQKPWR